MSFPVLKDLDKSITELINDDFDSKYTLKIKSAGPCNSTITTNHQYDDQQGKLVPKLTLKWAHDSGFSVEKLEVSADVKVVLETALVNSAPGLKLEFKGKNDDKADLSFTYKVPMATVTGDVDLIGLQKASTSVVGGQGPVLAGVSADFKLSNSSLDSTTIGVGASYTIPKTLVAVARADGNLSKYSALFSYNASSDVTLAGQLTYQKSPAATLAASYMCNPKTTIKVKATTGGVFAASIKQNCEKKFSVIGSVEVPGSLNGVKFGVNATLG